MRFGKAQAKSKKKKGRSGRERCRYDQRDAPACILRIAL